MKQVIRRRLLHWLALVLGIFLGATVFARPISFSSIVNPSFGDLLAGPSGRNFILSTTGTISGANASDYVSGAVAGSVHIVGDANKDVDILATNLTAGGGVSIANVTCNYGGAGDVDCDVGFTGLPPKPQGKTMLIGLEINTTQVHSDNDNAAPSFDIVVNYL